MGQRSFLSQLLQVGGTSIYSDIIANPHTQPVAEGQVTLEDDLNIVRTLLKDLLGDTYWYTAPAWDIKNISGKFFMYRRHEAGLDNVSISGASTTAFDTAIKGIPNHGSGGGNSSTRGVIVNSTRAYEVGLRDHSTHNAFDDGSGNEVYGRLSFTGGNYVVTFYSMKAGVETAYTFGASVTADASFVFFSDTYKNLPWDQFLDITFWDVAGFTGTVADTSVTVSGMSYLYNTLVTQHDINLKGDKLGHGDTAAEGAHLVKIDDTASGSNSYFAGLTVQAALNELKTQIGGATSTTYNFTNGTGSLLTDNDYVYPALDKLDQGFVKLMAYDTPAQGATMIGVYDAALVFTATTVEGVLKELYDSIQDVTGWDKQSETVGPLAAGAPHVLPGGMTFTPSVGGRNLDVYFRGQLLLAGAGNDYTEVAGAPSSSIIPLFTVPANSNLIYMARK